MFASPYVRRRFTALSLLIGALALLLLVLPSTSSGARTPVRHVVLPGESLWSIAAAQYGGDPREHLDAIAAANDLSSTLVPGEELVLP